MVPTDLKDTLTTKIGPLPAIAWGGILGGAYVVYRYYKASNAPAPSPIATGSETDLGTADDFNVGFGPTTPGLGGGSVVNSPTTVTTPDNNSLWGKLVSDWLIAQGFNPTDVQLAISSYLYGTGEALNSTQSAILRSALRQFGTPPEGVIPPPVTTPATPTTPPAKPPPVAKPVTLTPAQKAALDRAKSSFKAAQDLANLFKGPVEGPYGIKVQPGQLPPASWVPFDQALTDAKKAQDLANFVHGPVIGPGGRQYLPQ